MFYRLILVGLASFFVMVSSAQSIIVKPYLQDITTHSAKMMFETNTTTTAFVHYGDSPFNLSMTTEAFSQTGNGTSRIFTGQITGLSPLKKYYYKVVLGNNVQSSVYHFLTLDETHKEQNINFVSISDIQRTSAYPNVYTNLVNQGIIPVMNQELENGMDDLHGIIAPGDLVQSGGTYSQWKNDFFDLGENMTTIVPMYPSVGNHEYYSNGLQNYLKYFDLPLNGHTNFPEQWWYKDFSNIRVIALNSNSNTTEQNLQLTWLNNTLNAVCTDPVIDFVFVQLHAPYKSEMWTPGESNFTGQVVTAMENFTQNCQKPTIHLFGHTHGYSRGQSKYHDHLWINVASAGGALDYWGQFPNHDYEEFTHSEDEYGFVLLKGQAGPDPEVFVKRYSRGDDALMKNNEVTDSVILKMFDFPPAQPYGVWPDDSVDYNCVTLKASAFFDPNNFHQASQWQISDQINFSNIIHDSWRQHENLYQNVDTQTYDDLTDEQQIVVSPDQTYYWRVRYRDNYLRWSDWSVPKTFITREATTTPNLLTNANAENGITGWNGQVEALTSNQCNSVPVYAGTRFFGVGGICANEQDLGLADQTVNVAAYATDIDNGALQVFYGGYLRTWATNNDFPEISVQFLKADGQVVNAPFVGNNQPQWLLVQNMVPVPPLTRRIKFIMRGTRVAGGDNDSYFDELFMTLTSAVTCGPCIGASGIDVDDDGMCSDQDCDDNDASVYSGAAEICDGEDNDCDGVADSGVSAYWSGAGDATSWEDPANWVQNMVPLPCQHVYILTDDTVVVTDYRAVKSVTIGQDATCVVEAGAHMMIHSGMEAGISCWNLSGRLENYGRIDITQSNVDGIVLSGTLLNEGRIYINGIQVRNIVALDGSILENQGLMINK